jgi:glycosyltransferase involved in cell wall biosynthesis
MVALVSILIPAYNAERWIKDTINSALSQTWPRTEIIIVNDGSSDNTLAIAKQFELKSVKVISQENRGASAARNKALEYAQGDYIQWLDADDLLASDKISEQIKVAESGQTSLTLYSSPHGVFYWRYEKARFVPNSLWQDLAPVEWMERKFNENLWMNPAGWLVSRRLAVKAGPWDERLSLDDDGEYFSRVVAASENVKFVRDARCYYRLSGFNQLSLSISESACKSLLLSLKLCIRYVRSLEESERTRGASLALLQSCLEFFYPDKTELLKEMNAIAFELGGELIPPSFKWKFNLIRGLFGWKAAKEIRSACGKLKLGMAAKWDEMMYRITRVMDHESKEQK